MRITDTEQERDQKQESRMSELIQVSQYYYHERMKDREPETEIWRIALTLAVLTDLNTTWKDKNTFSRSKRKKKKKEET